MKVEQPDQVAPEPQPQPTEMEVETPFSLKEESESKPEPETETETQTQTEAAVTELPELNIKAEQPTDNSEEPSEEAEQETEEASSANTSLVGDESHMLAAPVMSQPKVGIKLNINRPIRSVERLESVASQSDTEESEFDVDAIITAKIEEEVLDSQKPRMKGKKFT